MNLTKALILSRLDRIVAGGDAGDVDLKDPKIAAAIEAAVEAAVGGLKTKNAELIRKLEGAKTAEEKAAKYDEIVAERDKLTAKVEELGGNNRALGKQLKDATEALGKESTFTQSLLIDGGLTNELSKAGVVPELMPAVKAMLKEMGAKVVVEGEARKAMIGDKELSAFVSAWATSDAGKHFVKATANQGGGANGGQGGNAGKALKEPVRKEYTSETDYYRDRAAWADQQAA